jgi:hypothetical protein
MAPSPSDLDVDSYHALPSLDRLKRALDALIVPAAEQ